MYKPLLRMLHISYTKQRCGTRDHKSEVTVNVTGAMHMYMCTVHTSHTLYYNGTHSLMAMCIYMYMYIVHCIIHLNIHIHVHTCMHVHVHVLVIPMN